MKMKTSTKTQKDIPEALFKKHKERQVEGSWKSKVHNELRVIPKTDHLSDAKMSVADKSMGQVPENHFE